MGSEYFMRSRRMYTGMAAITLALAMCSAAIFSPKGEAAEENEGYMLKSWCGRVAVYAANGTEPMETTDIELKNLPSADQKELEKGIFIQSDTQLAQILEDLGS